jgi:hypothetical protein
MWISAFLYTSAICLATFGAAQSTIKVQASAWAAGGNPTNLDMFYYAPPNLPPNSPLVVAVRVPFQKIEIVSDRRDRSISA